MLDLFLALTAELDEMNRILAELQQQGATSGGSTARDPNGELRRQVLKALLRVCVRACAPECVAWGWV